MHASNLVKPPSIFIFTIFISLQVGIAPIEEGCTLPDPGAGLGEPATLLGLARPLCDWGGLTMFSQWSGGILGLTPEGKVPDRPVITYVGVIDILQVFNLRKKLEGSVKGLRFNKSKISSIEAGKYADRFVKFIAARIE